jgi:sugar phosphate isomerase/epimerase
VHRLSLSTCWNTHRHTDGRILAKEVRDMGFSWLEVGEGMPEALVPGVMQAVQQRVMKVSSVQVPCLEGAGPGETGGLSSGRAEVRERAIARVVAGIELAAKLGADRVVVRAGRVAMADVTAKLERMALEGGLFGRAYVDEKLRVVAEREKAARGVLERVVDGLLAVVPTCEKYGVRVGIETGSHFEQFPTVQEMGELLKVFEGCPWMGVWHDFGHVQRQANLGFLDHAAYLGLNARKLIGCHVHDVEWPVQDHQIPLSKGGVDFERLMPLVPREVPLIWEIDPRQKRLEIIAAREAWAKRFGDAVAVR